MEDDQHDDQQPDSFTMSPARPVMLGLVALAILLAVSMVWIRRHDVSATAKASVPGGPAPEIQGGPVGTTGSDVPKGADDHGGPAAIVPPALIQELETITGAVDGHELIGRKVDLHVRVQEIANETAFWVGEPDNQVLVVLGRDNRNGSKRQAGVPAAHGILPVHAGQMAAISGTIRRLPKAEEMFSWDLTRTDHAELLDRPIYIRAEKVTANGHGTFRHGTF
jgi:hypothetical protein